MSDLISIAAALMLAAGVGYGVGDHRATQRARRPKTLEQLAREQGVRPWTSIDNMPTADPALFTEEDLASWDASIREARS